MIPIPDVPSVTPLSAATQIYICEGIPWDRQYKHVRLFGSKSACLSFVQGKAKYSTTEATPVRDNVARVTISQSDVLDDCNYIAYNNTNIHNFWVFGFIVNSTYISPNRTDIEFEIDIFQTYYYVCQLQTCYVERHHWARSLDTIGANTLPEPVSEGFTRYYQSKEFNFGKDGGSQDTSILIFLSDKDTLEVAQEPKVLGNVYTGLYYIHEKAELANAWVKDIIQKGKAQGIQSIFMCPKFCTTNNYEYLTLEHENAYGSLEAWKNNKMYTYPYCYVEVQMYGVGDFQLYYEKGLGNNIRVGIRGSMAPLPEVTCFADNYDMGQTHNMKHSLTFNSFPTCAVANDTYAQYLNSNQINNGFSVAMSGMKTVFQLANAASQIGNPGANIPMRIAGAAMGLFETAGGVEAANRTAQRQADGSVGTMGSGGILYEMEELKVKAIAYGWDETSAKAADDFMSVFGYNTQQVTMPNVNTRTLWNYVKTRDCNIIGNVSYNVREVLNRIFNSGVFIWHTNNIGNFDIGGNG